MGKQKNTRLLVKESKSKILITIIMAPHIYLIISKVLNFITINIKTIITKRISAFID